MAEERTPQNADKYIVRFPDGMRDRIADAAKASNRSMNAEIVARLQRTFENNSTSGNLITMTMDEFDVFTESLISRALERAGNATSSNQK